MKHWGPRIAGGCALALVVLVVYQGWIGAQDMSRALESELSGQTPDAYTLEQLANNLSDRGYDVTMAHVSGEVKVHEQIYRVRVSAPVTVLFVIPIRLPVGFRAAVDPEYLDLDGMRGRGWKVADVTPALNLR